MPDTLNDACHCISLDEAALRRHFDAAVLREGSLPELCVGREHLFAPYPVFANEHQVTAMRAVIEAAHEVMALPAFREQALRDSNWPDQHTQSAMMAFDFHPEPHGAKLIEINTNAGGAYLAALLAESQRACCVPVAGMLDSPTRASDVAQQLFEDFLSEWRLARGARPLTRVLIVDDRPREQFLYPEFLLFRELFRRHGIAADIADTRELQFDGEVLVYDGQQVDLIYNRCTDFRLGATGHEALRAACMQDAVVLTPSPRHHALFADKRHLVTLSDDACLQRIGASATARKVLAAHVPKARVVTGADAGQLWSERKRYFFKPFSGHASRGVYRGERLTKRVWSEIVASGNYIAQEFAPPATRRGMPGKEAPTLKFDLRCVTYAAQIRLVNARLYQGQATNMRTVSGGLASVFMIGSAGGSTDPQPPAGSLVSPNQTTA